MNKEWYIIDNGVQRGPMPAGDLRNYGLTPSSMVWTQGMKDWMPAGQCPELEALLGNPGTVNSEGAAYETPYVEEVPGNNNGAFYAGQQPPYGGNQYGGNQYGGNAPYGQRNPNGSGKSNIVAGLLAIFLGTLGIQYFYVGKVSAGLITILLSLVTCGGWEIVTLIQGIYMLTLDQQQFDNKYVYNPSTFPLF